MRVSAAPCPVCDRDAGRLFACVDGRDYYRCRICEATFLARDQLPSAQEELEEYLLHRNAPDDPAYRGFLSRLTEPLLARLAPGATGLDYGCGPGPTLAALMRAGGHRMALYDPFFHPNPEALECTYDFVTCTEVVEHFHHPAREFRRLDALLKPGGWLAIQTAFQTDDARFARWNYRRDPTHVVFYRSHTFQRIAQCHGWDPVFPDHNIVFMRKPAAGR
jgi:2-polyprenyl-3-methyl-5-hydroxy-6-metoxy-1,4-benzoquinol methylase